MAEIKNVVDNTDLTGHEGVNDSKVANWISQINAGGTVYDIATHHGITFKDGSTDTTGVVWNGLTDLEIVIPSITDIVQTPIEFVGTVNADGKVMDGTKEITTFEKGNLVFIAANCTFNGKVCEAGDMAIYDGSEWKVVTGENQVSIVGNNGEAKTTIAIGPAKEVLTVEGKTLELTLDYADLNKHVSVTKGGSENAPVKFGNMTVDSAYLKLSQAAGSPKTIGKAETIQKASKLKDGTITLTGTGDIVTDVTFGTFNAGSLHEIVLNADARTFAVTGGSLTKNTGTTGDFVTNVTLDDVTFGTSTQGATGAFTLVNGITPGSGQSFVTGVSGETGGFTVAGCLQPTDGANAKYVKGIEGSYLTGVTGGDFKLNNNGTEVVVGFETTEKDSGDVISSITVSAKNDTSVLNAATVISHVLTFASTNVVSGVDVTPKYKSLTKTGFTYTPVTATSAAFVNSGFTLSSDVKYTFTTDNETTYTTTSGYYKLTTPDLKVSYGGYTLSNDGMVANVSANTFAVNVSGGVLPTLGTSSVTKKANITGSVATDLEYTDISINVVDSTAMSITLPGAYSLVSGSAGDGVEVGKAGELAAKNATIDLRNYVTGVAITESTNA